jgi:DNA-binding transcriptional regulator YhcF (GntR family)
MEIIINIEDVTPLFAQLIEQIKKAVASDQIKAGDPLPSIRQLANDLEINNKTVAKAYRLLERDSIIQAKGYRGSFIHPNAKKNCDIDINGLIETKLTATLNELKQAGATDSEIRIAFAGILKNKNNGE